MAMEHGYPEIEARFRKSGAAYVASTAVTATINDAVRTLELAKRLDPGVVTILGGVHPTFMYEEVLTGSSAVDFVVIGEGEETLRQLLAVLEEGGDPATVPGLAFRQGERIVTTGSRPLRDNLDDFPAAWDLIEWNLYEYFVIPGSRLGAIGTSRGCGHDGVTSPQQRFWEKTWRGRSPEKVAEEIDYLHRTHGVTVFLLTDEHPTRDRQRWEELLDRIIGKGIPVRLLMETRSADIVRDGDILWKYRKAGVIYISIGTQPAGGENGGETAGAKQALDLIHDHGIVSEASFMIGFPDETGESVKRTFQLVQRYNPDNANFLAVTPWPYGEHSAGMADFVKERDYGKYNLVDPVIEPKEMSLHQVEVAIVDCYRKFYMAKIIDVMTMKDDFRRACMVRFTKLFMGSSFVFRKLGVGLRAKLGFKAKG